jgi:hypothetical protein
MAHPPSTAGVCEAGRPIGGEPGIELRGRAPRNFAARPPPPPQLRARSNGGGRCRVIGSGWSRVRSGAPQGGKIYDWARSCFASPPHSQRAIRAINSVEPDPQPIRSSSSEASQRSGGRPCSEISAARPRTPIPDLPPFGPPASQTSAVLGGRAIRCTASPRPAHKTERALRRDGAADLTFNPGWLNFPALRAEGCALESRLVVRTTRMALAKRTSPPN